MYLSLFTSTEIHIFRLIKIQGYKSISIILTEVLAYNKEVTEKLRNIV